VKNVKRRLPAYEKAMGLIVIVRSLGDDDDGLCIAFTTDGECTEP
jgi:hypothetical protein